MKKIVVGISGASGTVYAFETLRALRELGVESHVVISEGARRTLAAESSLDIHELESLASVLYAPNDLAASIASGSFHTDGMVVVPCSIKSASAIAYGFNDNLIARAADVCLKERRTTVLVVRETPLHLGHLRTMTQLAEIGAIILPPIPALYTRPTSVEDIVRHTVGKIVDQFGIENTLFRRWNGPPKTS